MAVYDDGASVNDDGMPLEILRDEIGNVSAVAAAGQHLPSTELSSHGVSFTQL